MDAGGGLIEPVLGFHQLATAAPGAGEPAKEPGVDRLVNAHDMHPDPGQQRADPCQDLVLVADLPVGDQDQHAVTGGRAAGPR